MWPTIQKYQYLILVVDWMLGIICYNPIAIFTNLGYQTAELFCKLDRHLSTYGIFQVMQSKVCGNYNPIQTDAT